MNASTTHVVLIPSYNTGATVYETVRAASAQWQPVWVVVDGSDDGTAAGLTALAASDPDRYLATATLDGCVAGRFSDRPPSYCFAYSSESSTTTLPCMVE